MKHFVILILFVFVLEFACLRNPAYATEEDEGYCNDTSSYVTVHKDQVVCKKIEGEDPSYPDYTYPYQVDGEPQCWLPGSYEITTIADFDEACAAARTIEVTLGWGYLANPIPPPCTVCWKCPPTDQSEHELEDCTDEGITELPPIRIGLHGCQIGKLRKCECENPVE